MSKQASDQQDVERYESGQLAEKPEPSDEQKKQASETSKSYEDDRPTTVLPGSGGTVSGTAVNDWVDDEGNPKFGQSDHAQDEDEGQRSAER